MIKKSVFSVCIYSLLAFSHVQAAVHLINVPDIQDLAAVKKQIENIQLEEIVINSFVDASKNETLQRRGLLLRKPHALGTVVICHGYLGCKRHAIFFKHLFPDYNVLSFDFRAHGDDKDGQYSTIGRDEALDVIAAVQFVKSDPDMAGKPVIAFGYSMGAVSAIQAQAADQTLFDAMILDCPFASTDEAMRRGLEDKMKISLFGTQFAIPGKQFILDHMYDDAAQALTNFLFKVITQLDSKKVATKFVRVTPVESVKKITVPCFFIHCENDKKVTVGDVESLYKNKPGFKRLWITQGQSHFGSYPHNPELYWYKVNKFLKKLHEQQLHERDQEKVCDHRAKVTIANNTITIEVDDDLKKFSKPSIKPSNIVIDGNVTNFENMIEDLM
jgi:pimeloyl-ACP methyl ester carboxylesterase